MADQLHFGARATEHVCLLGRLWLSNRAISGRVDIGWLYTTLAGYNMGWSVEAGGGGGGTPVPSSLQLGSTIFFFASVM